MKTTLRRHVKTMLISFFLMLIGQAFYVRSFAQTLVQGDISIVAFNANAPDNFAFVTWKNLPPLTVIKFMDNGFNNGGSSGLAGNLRDQEQYITWRNNTGTTIIAGTVITISSSTNPMNTNIGEIVSVLNSSGTSAPSMALINTSGDQIFAFQGTGAVTPGNNTTTSSFSGTLLFGLGYSGFTGTATSWVTAGGINGSTTYRPSDLNTTSSYIFFGANVVAAQYIGPRDGETTLDAYKALVANTSSTYWTRFTLTGSTGPLDVTSFITGTLPLSLVSFTGNESGDGVFLQWTTANEVNMAGYDIERSGNGSGFTALASVAAGATYSYTDRTATAGTVYTYRLKMRDADGHFMYSASVSVRYKGAATTGYSVYPNPATGTHLYVKPPAGAVFQVQVAIVDLGGRTLYSSSFTASQARNGRFEIPVKQLPAGAYVLRISDKNGTSLQTTRFTVGD
jgi:hypothetical protein